MTDGCYDLDGKCVNCNTFHPCSCEGMSIDDFGIDDQDIQAVVDDYNDRRELREVKE